MSKLATMSTCSSAQPSAESRVDEAAVTASRRRMRVTALQVLYEIDSVRRDPDLAFESLLGIWPLPSGSEERAREIVKGVIENRGALDDLIAKHAPSWPVEQLAIVDRNILRVAMYEMLIGRRTPSKVAINEGVEVAKAYGADGSPGFVNGVLGAVLREEAQRRA